MRTLRHIAYTSLENNKKCRNIFTNKNASTFPCVNVEEYKAFTTMHFIQERIVRFGKPTLQRFAITRDNKKHKQALKMILEKIYNQNCYITECDATDEIHFIFHEQN